MRVIINCVDASHIPIETQSAFIKNNGGGTHRYLKTWNQTLPRTLNHLLKISYTEKYMCAVLNRLWPFNFPHIYLHLSKSIQEIKNQPSQNQF